MSSGSPTAGPGPAPSRRLTTSNSRPTGFRSELDVWVVDSHIGANIGERCKSDLHDRETSTAPRPVDRKMFPIERKDFRQRFAFSDTHERCIGEVHRQVAIFL